MGTIRRQSIKTTLVIATGVLLGFFLKLFVFTAYLKPNEIGLLTVLIDTANLFATFIPLGSQSIFVRYLPYFRKGNSNSNGLLFLGLFLSLTGFLIFSLFFLLAKDSLADYYSVRAPLFSDYIFYLLPLVVARVLFTLGDAYSRANKKIVFPFFVKEILIRILTGIAVLAFARKWFDIDGLVFWYVALYLFSGALVIFYIFRLSKVNLKPDFDKLKKDKIREILYFGLFAILTSGGSVIIRNIDSLMIITLKSLDDAGIYSIAFFVGVLIEMPRRAISQISAPFIAEASHNNNKRQIGIIYHKSSINQFLIGSLILICVWTNIDSLFRIIPNGDIYAQGKYVVLFIGLGKLFDMSMGINNEIIQNSPYHRFNFYTMSVLGVLNIITNLIFIPMMGIVGAAIASMISISLINITKAVYIRSKLGLQPFKINSLIALSIGLLVYLMAFLLPSLNNAYLDILYRSSITAIVFFLAILLLKVSQDFNMIFNQLKNIFFKKNI